MSAFLARYRQRLRGGPAPAERPQWDPRLVAEFVRNFDATRKRMKERPVLIKIDRWQEPEEPTAKAGVPRRPIKPLGDLGAEAEPPQQADDKPDVPPIPPQERHQ